MGRDSDETVMAFERRRADVPSFLVAAIALVMIASVFGLCVGAFVESVAVAAWLIDGVVDGAMRWLIGGGT